MPYMISATNQIGAISFARDTLEEAQQKAVELQNRGMKNVTIRDPQGVDVLDTDESNKFNDDN